MRLSRHNEPSLGWHSRGYLPHFDGGELAQFITFRLHDSLPREVVIRWKEELKLQPSEAAQSLMRKRVEVYLDQGHGECYLRDHEVAQMAQHALLFHDKVKYHLSTWVIMPNHVHLLCAPMVGASLAGIMHSIKSFTSSEANKMLGRRGRF